MLSARISLATLALSVCGSSVYAQPPAGSVAPRYPGIRTQFNQGLSQARTNEQLLDLFRHTVEQGRHPWMVRRMFGDFQPGSFTLSPTTRGLDKTVRLLASDNRNVVTGNARTLLYANSLQGDGRFQVTDLNRSRANSVGRTDADIVFRHKATGLQGRMEVKDVSLSSQRANLAKIQSQILKMAHDARLTGEIQIWGNRQNILPEIRTFAEQHGIPVAERLRTGTSNLRPEDLRFERFANELDQRFRFQARLNAIAGSVRLGMGAFMAYQASRQLENDFSDFGGSQRDWLRLGEHASILLGGGSFAVAGTAQLLTHQIPRLADNGRLISVTRWGGRAGVAGTVLTEGFLISQYISGDLTERQFLLGQASFGAGLAGGAAGGYVGLKAGALAGGAIGSIFGPAGTAIGAGIGGTIGAIGGGIGGGYAGAHFAERSVESLYQFQDSEQAERYAQFLLRHYQSR